MGTPSLHFVFAKTLRCFRMPGIIVPTVLFSRINLKARVAISESSGIKGRNKSARSALAFRFSATKYVPLQSPSGKVDSRVIEPVSVPSSKGTRAITAISLASQNGKRRSSGA